MCAVDDDLVLKVLAVSDALGECSGPLCMALDGVAELLSDSWTASGGELGGLGEVLGVKMGPTW